MIRILVTAFGAFPGARVNPTVAIVTALARRKRVLHLRRIAIETRILPVVFEGTSERIRKMVSQARPDVVLHLGLAGRRKTLSVETRALNRLTILHRDALRRRSGAILVETGGQPIRRSRYAAARLARTLSAAGAQARLSIDAGDYLCNQTLYHSLGLHGGVCGFIHVPRPRALRRPRKVNGLASNRPTLATMACAVEVLLGQLAVEHRFRNPVRCDLTPLRP